MVMQVVQRHLHGDRIAPHTRELAQRRGGAGAARARGGARDAQLRREAATSVPRLPRSARSAACHSPRAGSALQ
jgi:hypothetical protein